MKRGRGHDPKSVELDFDPSEYAVVRATMAPIKLLANNATVMLKLVTVLEKSHDIAMERAMKRHKAMREGAQGDIFASLADRIENSRPDSPDELGQIDPDADEDEDEDEDEDDLADMEDNEEDGGGFGKRKKVVAMVFSEKTQIPAWGPRVRYRVEYPAGFDPNPKIGDIRIIQFTILRSPLTLHKAIRLAKAFCPGLTREMELLEGRYRSIVAGKAKITSPVDFVCIESGVLRHILMDMYKGVFMSLECRQTHLLLRKKWGNISEHFAKKFFRQVREGNGLNLMFPVSSDAVPHELVVVQCLNQSMATCGRKRIKGEPREENRIIKEISPLLYRSSLLDTALPSALWLKYLESAKRTGEFVFQPAALLSEYDGTVEFGPTDNDTRKITTLLKEAQAIATFGPDECWAVPLVIAKAIKKLDRLLTKTPALRATFVIGRFGQVANYIRDFHVSEDISFPQPSKRVVICPTESMAHKVDPRHGYAVVRVADLDPDDRMARGSPLFGVEIVVLDGAHLFSARDFLAVASLLSKSMQKCYTSPRLYICGADADVRADDLDRAPRLFAEMLQCVPGFAPVYLVPIVTAAHVREAMTVPWSAPEGLTVGTRLLYADDKNTSASTRVADSEVLAKRAAATLRALLNKVHSDKCVVLYDSAGTRSAIEKQLAAASSLDDDDATGEVISRRDVVTEADGGQRRVLNFYETTSGGERAPVVIRTPEQTALPYIHYRLEGDDRDTYRHVSDFPIKKGAVSTTYKCGLSPAPTVVLVCGAPFIKQTDLDLAVFLAEETLCVLCSPGAISGDGSVARRPIENPLWDRIVPETLKVLAPPE